MSDVEEKEILEEEILENDTPCGETADDLSGDSKEEACLGDDGYNEEMLGEGTQEENVDDKKAGKKKWKGDKRQDAKLIQDQKEKIEVLEDKVKRQMAEFDNFRKRTEKEKSTMFETGAKSVIEKVLPIIDNFERGLSCVPDSESGGAFAEGMNMIYKQLMTELENIGVKAIEAVGCEFDPELHNAVMQVESDEFESGVVAQELQKGYMYRDTVVRHSMVGVVQ